MSKKIGILTSGGDCAGLNAVIRAVTLRSVNKYGWQVFGIKDGTLGLMTNPLNVIELKKKKHQASNLIRMIKITKYLQYLMMYIILEKKNLER